MCVTDADTHRQMDFRSILCARAKLSFAYLFGRKSSQQYSVGYLLCRGVPYESRDLLRYPLNNLSPCSALNIAPGRTDSPFFRRANRIRTRKEGKEKTRRLQSDGSLSLSRLKQQDAKIFQAQFAQMKNSHIEFRGASVRQI